MGKEGQSQKKTTAPPTSNKPPPPTPPSSHHGTPQASSKPPSKPVPPPSQLNQAKTNADKSKSNKPAAAPEVRPKGHEKKATISIRLSKASQQKGRSKATSPGGKNTGVIMVSASMPEVGVLTPPAGERSTTFSCVWPTVSDGECKLLVEDTTINAIAVQVLKNTVGKLEDREMSCLLFPLLPDQQKQTTPTTPNRSCYNSQSTEQLLAKLNSQIFDSRGSGGCRTLADAQTAKPPFNRTAQGGTGESEKSKSGSGSSKAGTPVKPRQFTKAPVSSVSPAASSAVSRPTEGKSPFDAPANTSTSMATTYSKFSQFEFSSAPPGGGNSFFESKASTFSKFSQNSTASGASKASNYSKFMPVDQGGGGSFAGATKSASTYSKYNQFKSGKTGHQSPSSAGSAGSTVSTKSKNSNNKSNSTK